MSDYRLYFLSGSSEHIERFEPITAGTDREAVCLAAEYSGARPLELWLAGRKVGRLERSLAARPLDKADA